MQTRFQHGYRWTADVMAALRGALQQEQFDEILPVILSERYEPGARHAIAVLGDRTRPDIDRKRGKDGSDEVTVTGQCHFFLPVSHCVEKQLSLEYLERVYCIAPCVRLLMDGEDESGRHLCTFFQAEIEWRTESADDVYRTIERVLAALSASLLETISDREEVGVAARKRIQSLGKTPYPRLTFAEAKQRAAGAGGRDNPHATGDLTHAEEFALSNAHDSPFWITDYPEQVRDSLYRQSDDGTLLSYDLMLPDGFGELATGGLRPVSADSILDQAGRLGEKPHPHYANWKSRTRIQTGGLGFGIERLVRYCSDSQSVLDLLVAHDQGPNAAIGVDEGRAVA